MITVVAIQTYDSGPLISCYHCILTKTRKIVAQMFSVGQFNTVTHLICNVIIPCCSCGMSLRLANSSSADSPDDSAYPDSSLSSLSPLSPLSTASPLSALSVDSSESYFCFKKTVDIVALHLIICLVLNSSYVNSRKQNCKNRLH